MYKLRIIGIGICKVSIILILSACSGDESTSTTDCDPQSCTGCCHPTDGCQSGTTDQYCGPNGGACSSCSDGQSCNAESRICVGDEPQTCTQGCIIPNTTSCITPGTANDACGPAGGKCVNCLDSDKICDAATHSCIERPSECEPSKDFSCKSQSSYCDAGNCRKCDLGKFNCDGKNDNACENDQSCDKPPGCASQIEAWPQLLPVASYSAMGQLTQGEIRLTSGQPYVLLRIEDFHEQGNYPKTVHFSSATKWNNPRCDVCVMIATKCTGYEGSAENYYNCTGKLYFAQAGSATVTQADVKPSPGAFKATMKDLKLVEWDEDADEPVPDGDCWEVGSATIDATW